MELRQKDQTYSRRKECDSPDEFTCLCCNTPKNYAWLKTTKKNRVCPRIIFKRYFLITQMTLKASTGELYPLVVDNLLKITWHYLFYITIFKSISQHIKCVNHIEIGKLEQI